MRRRFLHPDLRGRRSHQDAAVHRKLDPRNELGFVGRQPHAGIGHVLRSPEPGKAQRTNDRARHRILHYLLRGIGAAGDESDDDHIAADPVLAVLHCHLSSQGIQRALCGRVGGKPLQTNLGRHRADIDNRPAPASLHQGHCVLAAPEGTGRGHSQHELPALRWQIDNGLLAALRDKVRRSRVVDEDVEPPPGRIGLRNQRAYIVFAAHVRLHEDGLAARRGDRADDRGAGRGVAAGDDDPGALGREYSGDGTADALRRAGDDCDLA